MKKCVACHLKDSRINVVPGLYGEKNGLCFIGEAPGYNEDKQGKPFVGRSGKLLDKMMHLIGYSRKNVSILNVVKCRPTTVDGNNRTPKVTEVRFCAEKWLYKQLELLSPKLLVTLGSISLNLFFPSSSVTKMAGTLRKISNDYFVFITYHPAYLLRRQTQDLLNEYETHFKQIAELMKFDQIKDDSFSEDFVLEINKKQKKLTDYFN